MRLDLVERVVLRLTEVREPAALVATVANVLAQETGRTCLGVAPGDARFAALAATVGTEPVTLGSDAVLLAATVDGAVRAVFALAGPPAEFSAEDVGLLRIVAGHASLALAGAVTVEQLRRHAVQGAALSDAARTLLDFTALEPLAAALCALGRRFVYADCCGFYARSGSELRRVAVACAADAHMPESLPADRAECERALARGAGDNVAVAPLRLPGGRDEDMGGLIVVMRPTPLDKGDQRLLDALVSLAALAVRNVELYEQSARANRALEESNAFKDDLMAMFAHDFKGPLTVIYGHAELLLEDGLAADGKSSAEAILGQTRRLAKLAEDALALAATQSAGFSLKRSRNDLVAFAAEAAADADAGNGRIALAAPGAPLVVSFDETRLRYALDSLLGNALKYSTGAVRVTVGAAGGEATVRIADDGIGIPAAEMDRIFTRFGRASNARERRFAGSGVGLYIARKIAEVHGGRLTVTSVEGEGSTFTMTLPFDSRE